MWKGQTCVRLSWSLISMIFFFVPKCTPNTHTRGHTTEALKMSDTNTLDWISVGWNAFWRACDKTMFNQNKHFVFCFCLLPKTVPKPFDSLLAPFCFGVTNRVICWCWCASACVSVIQLQYPCCRQKYKGKSRKHFRSLKDAWIFGDQVTSEIPCGNHQLHRHHRWWRAQRVRMFHLLQSNPLS